MTSEIATEWNGVERRNLSFCGSHLDMVKSIAVIETTIINLDKRINGSLVAIEKHMDQGAQWRMGIIGVALTLFIQAILIINYNGKMMKQIEVNTIRLDKIENLHPMGSDHKTEMDDDFSKRMVRK